MPNCGGRDIGTPRMSSLVQMPSRSGWPHASFGAVHFGLTTVAADASADSLA